MFALTTTTTYGGIIPMSDVRFFIALFFLYTVLKHTTTQLVYGNEGGIARNVTRQYLMQSYMYTAGMKYMISFSFVDHEHKISSQFGFCMLYRFKSVIRQHTKIQAPNGSSGGIKHVFNFRLNLVHPTSFNLVHTFSRNSVHLIWASSNARVRFSY